MPSKHDEQSMLLLFFTLLFFRSSEDIQYLQSTLSNYFLDFTNFQDFGIVFTIAVHWTMVMAGCH